MKLFSSFLIKILNLSLSVCFCLYLIGSFPTGAHATLIDRGGGLIYDQDLDITWMQDAGLGGIRILHDPDPSAVPEHIPGTGGREWADSFTYYDSVREIYWSDWRLPTGDLSTGPCSGYNCSNNELAHLYYDEGISVSSSGPFINIQTLPYWWEVEGVGHSKFSFTDGYQFDDPFDVSDAIWLVRDGDVGAVVPEPGTLILLGCGLFGAGLFRRKNKPTIP